MWSLFILLFIDDSDGESVEDWEENALGIEECLFCSHISSSLESNVNHMTKKHSFFLPDAGFIADLEGLVVYLGNINLIHNILKRGTKMSF